MGPMTVFEAESEAQWRWGGVLTRGVARYTTGTARPFEVGWKRLGAVTIRGRGVSWEAAFRDAMTNAENEGKRGPAAPPTPAGKAHLPGAHPRTSTT